MVYIDMIMPILGEAMIVIMENRINKDKTLENMWSI